MARGANQKLKLLRLLQILSENTDDAHGITMQQLLALLRRYGIEAERKSVHADLEALSLCGVDVVTEKKGTTCYYHIGNRIFELAELKLLVDAVQSSKFITEKKSHKLIKKLEGFLSRYEAKKLQRQVFVSGRIKTMNESIYYNVDIIHEAIVSNVQVKFKYYNWDTKKNMVLRHEGADFIISPWGLLWDNENYYMIGFDSSAGIMKHYRVDKMLKLRKANEKRQGREYYREYDIVTYTQKHFGMFDGQQERVKIQFENHFAGVVVDRFGKDVIMHKADEGHFTILVDVAVSEQFFGWVFALGSGAKIVEPEAVVQQMRAHIRKEMEMYENQEKIKKT